MIIMSPVSWGCRISAEEKDSSKCPGYNIKQFDGEAPVLEIWGIWSTPSLPSLPGSLWPRVVACNRVLSLGQIEVFDI